MNISCGEDDIKIARRQRERRWQRGVAAARSYSLNRVSMASRPLLVTTSEGSLATEDDNHANDGRASVALGWYHATFVGQL